MSNLKLLNKFFFQFFVIIIFIFPSISEETEDIWKINNEINSTQDNEETLISNDENEISIYDSLKPIENNIEEDSKLASKENKIFGLLDPEENNLTIDMWNNSDGKIILDKLKKIEQLKLSKDAENILFIALFTNAYSPKKNILPNVFSDYKSEWLIKEKKINLIEKYLEKNQNLGNQTKLIEFLMNEYLSEADINKACEKINLLNYNYSSEYLDKFKIYCLVNDNKIEEAQLQFDLLKENGFKNHFYDTKLFWDRFAHGKFGKYLIRRNESPPSNINDDVVHRTIEESQLFIEAAHACYAKLRDVEVIEQKEKGA